MQVETVPAIIDGRDLPASPVDEMLSPDAAGRLHEAMSDAFVTCEDAHRLRQFGLRFSRSQARVLEGTAGLLDRDGHREMARLARKAAKAARLKQPMPLGGMLDEVEAAADGFARIPGVTRPTVTEIRRGI